MSTTNAFKKYLWFKCHMMEDTSLLLQEISKIHINIFRSTYLYLGMYLLYKSLLCLFVQDAMAKMLLSRFAEPLKPTEKII